MLTASDVDFGVADEGTKAKKSHTDFLRGYREGLQESRDKDAEEEHRFRVPHDGVNEGEERQ